MSNSLEDEYRGYVEDRQPGEAQRLVAAGVAPLDILVHRMVGSARVWIDRSGLWQPDEAGQRMFITPVRINPANQPHHLESENPNARDAARYGELIDLVAWQPQRPGQWGLRTGLGMVLGGTDYRLSDDERPVMVHRGPLEWLRSGKGIVLLTRDPQERRLLLSGVPGVIAEDRAHAVELRRLLEREPTRVQVARVERPVDQRPVATQRRRLRM